VFNSLSPAYGLSSIDEHLTPAPKTKVAVVKIVPVQPVMIRIMMIVSDHDPAERNPLKLHHGQRR
jgi:hypothetical protein